MIYSRFYARRLFSFQGSLIFLSFALLYIYYIILFAVCQEVSQKFFVNFLWTSLTLSRCCLFLCCDYIIPYSEAFVKSFFEKNWDSAICTKNKWVFSDIVYILVFLKVLSGSWYGINSKTPFIHLYTDYTLFLHIYSRLFSQNHIFGGRVNPITVCKAL